MPSCRDAVVKRLRTRVGGRARPTLEFSLDRIEIERYHRDMLQLALDETNRQYREWCNEQDQHRAREQAARENHSKRVEDVSKKITFD
jgi:hypothetical protein